MRPPKGVFPVVGVGASAGGLEAFRELIAPLPATPGVALVLVQHLDPTHESLLVPALAGSSKMPVSEVKDGERVEPNRVYVMPSNATLTIKRGKLKLAKRVGTARANLPIDAFFRALAEDAGERAIGVVLSGTGRDGTVGLAAIRAQGGMAIVQDPATAKFDGMPRSAIGAGAVDAVLSPREIAARIASDALGPSTAGDLSGAGVERSLALLVARLQKATGVDFSNYKRTTILRRLGRRLAAHELTQVDDYIAYVDAHPEELRLLHDELLIHVTELFRDPESFEALKTRVLPAILDKKGAGAPIRIWVPGCSTGEEVYSIAILVSELLTERKAHHPVQIFGSDVSASVIAYARGGLYPASALRDLSEQRRERFFTKADASFRVRESLRELCVFVRHDVTSDPPFSKIDLISCRNLMIYFDAALQKKTVPLLHYALNEGGFLVLGRSETLAPYSALFALVDKANKVYRRRPGKSRSMGALSLGAPQLAPSAEPKPLHASVRASELLREMEQALIARYAPAGVLVNEDLEIVHFWGRTGPFLEPAPGQANLHLLRMAREGLVVPLRAMLAQARRTKVAVRREGIRSMAGTDPVTVNLEVLPLRSRGREEPSLLVTFEEHAAAKLRPPKPGSRAAATEKYLRQELAEAKSFLRSVVERHAATNDELVAANEELLSGNEELQSTNEELNTAKEELQSTNEELNTVNDELQTRNTDLLRLNDDLVNLLASVDIAIVILDRDRKIRRFTPKARALMNLIPTDVGRPIGDINPTVVVPQLEGWISESLESLGVKEVEVKDRAGRWYRLQIRPYRTSQDVIDGVVISLVDVDVLKQIAAEAFAARDFATKIVETVPVPTVLLDAALNVKSANVAFFETFGITPAQTLGRPIQVLTEGGWLPPAMQAPLESALAARSPFELVEVEHDVPRRGRRTMMLTGRMIGDGDPLVLIAIQDVTDLKRADDARVRLASLEQASREKDTFLAMLSHELRTPLNSILLWSQVLRKDQTIPAAAQRALQGIEHSAKAQSQIVDDLLDVSRIIAGKLQVAQADVDLARVVASAVDTVQADASAKSVSLGVRIDPDHPHVLGDAKRLTQVVWNLLSNAVKFTPPSGHVSLRLATVNERAQLVVEDDGVGVDPAFLPRVFERFAQQDSTTTRAHGGLGLGLGLARRIVELHGGTIRLENNAGGAGATATVELPLFAARSVTAAAPSASPLASSLRGLRVLAIDDDSECRVLLSHVLEEHGAKVTLVASAAAARAALETFTPDVIVCDVGMPVEDGLTFIRSLRALPPSRGGKIPAAALTAYADEENRLLAIAAGFQMHLTKPIDVDNLLAAIASLAR